MLMLMCVEGRGGGGGTHWGGRDEQQQQAHTYTTHTAQVLALVRHKELLEDPDNGASLELDEKLRLRAPYVAPLNMLQVHSVELHDMCWHACARVLDLTPTIPPTQRHTGADAVQSA